MIEIPRTTFRVSGEYQPLVRQVGIDADSIFTDPRIMVWRRLPDRENCTLDADLPNGVHVRWHIKRYSVDNGFTLPADIEVRGHQALFYAGIPTAPLVGFGKRVDRRSFVIFDDLGGYKPSDKLLEGGVPFDTLLIPTADLAAQLHNAGLHHRDLYLCHFMARVAGKSVDVKLIDSARVRRLPGFLTRSRWIVKDLAQFWYSTLRHSMTDAQRRAWLERYAQKREVTRIDTMQRAIERKSRSIARHDARLHEKRPERDVSIPS